MKCEFCGAPSVDYSHECDQMPTVERNTRRALNSLFDGDEREARVYARGKIILWSSCLASVGLWFMHFGFGWGWIHAVLMTCTTLLIALVVASLSGGSPTTALIAARQERNNLWFVPRRKS